MTDPGDYTTVQVNNLEVWVNDPMNAPALTKQTIYRDQSGYLIPLGLIANDRYYIYLNQEWQVDALRDMLDAVDQEMDSQ